MEQQRRLVQILNDSKLVTEILELAQGLGIQQYYIGAGCITQTVWNHLYQRPDGYGIKDIDFVYFDACTDYESEDQVLRRVRAAFASIHLDVDVKNQARVHLWYQSKFGTAILPYLDLESAMATWPTTATAIGVRKRPDRTENLEVYAPFGLDDLLSGVVRANKIQITRDVYEAKVNRWTAVWPELRVVPWEQE